MRKLMWISIAVIALIGVITITHLSFAKVNDIKDSVKEPSNTSFCDEIHPDLLRMIRKTLTTLDYIENHISETVTDVAVGTRILEAQLDILLRTKQNLNLTIQEDLKALQRKSKLIADAILQKYSSETYLKNSSMKNVPRSRIMKNLQWIKSASIWKTPAVKQWKTLGCNADIKPAENVSMAKDFGKLSDGCMFATFGNCSIPVYCIDFMWKEPRSGYLLTHQILFHYLIIQNECFTGEDKVLYESRNLTEPKKFLETLCRLVMTEAILIESLDYPTDKQDLFVEQILVCSLAGYNEFLKQKWIDVILDWDPWDVILQK